MKKYISKKQILTIAVIGGTIAAFNMSPTKKISETNKTTTIIAHRGGGALNPENTLGALKYSQNFFKTNKIDGWQEIDLRLTKDGQIVAFHNFYIGTGHPLTPTKEKEDTPTTCGNSVSGKIRDFNYVTLKSCGLLPRFKDQYPDSDPLNPQGNFKIPTLDAIFTQVPDIKLVLDFKLYHSFGYSREWIKQAYIEMFRIIEKHNKWNDVMIGVLFDSVAIKEINEYAQRKYKQKPLIIASWGDKIQSLVKENQAKNYDSYYWLKDSAMYPAHFKVLSRPYKFMDESYKDQVVKIRDKARKNNILDLWWTINDKESAKDLIKKEVWAVFSDNPIMIYEVLKEQQK